MAEKPFDIKKTVTRLKTVGGAVMHVTAAAPRRDKLVRCVLKYRKKGAEEAKEYELETVGDHTTWEKLSERVIAALWPNRRDTQNTVAMLEFAPLAPPGAEVEVVYILDTPTLMRALQAFRDTYELRKSAAIDKIIAEVEGLMRSGDPEAIARGARMIQALMQTSLDPETHAKLLGLLTEGLEKQKDHENGARDALELAAGPRARVAVGVDLRAREVVRLALEDRLRPRLLGLRAHICSAARVLEERQEDLDALVDDGRDGRVDVGRRGPLAAPERARGRAPLRGCGLARRLGRA